MSQTTVKTWNASDYDDQHSYVWKLGNDAVELMAPQSGERILDVGCGTGHLTHSIASRAGVVVGLDSSPEMIEKARKEYPQITFVVGNITKYATDKPFDAVFSNATLHWVKDAAAAIRCIKAALRPGGRFVAEFGGYGNVQHIRSAIAAALKSVAGPDFESVSPWYFPSIGQYATLLEKAGFEVSQAMLFDRPTRLEGGIRSWLEMFGSLFLESIHPDRRETFFERAQEAARAQLFRDGQWFADYRRIRIRAYNRA